MAADGSMARRTRRRGAAFTADSRAVCVDCMSSCVAGQRDGQSLCERTTAKGPRNGSFGPLERSTLRKSLESDSTHPTQAACTFVRALSSE